MSYPKSLKQRAIQLANDGMSAEGIVEKFSKEVQKGQHDYTPTPRTIRNWLQRGKEPTNWIDAHKVKTGKLPPLPHYLVELFGNYSSTVSKEMIPITPSGQKWNRLLPSQSKEWRELVEWLGKDPEDYLAHMRMMLPKNPPGIDRQRWTPIEQR